MFRYSVSNRSSCESTLSHDLSTSHSRTECSLGCPPPPNFSIQRMYFMIYAELIVRTRSRPLCSCFAAVLLICLSSCLCPREEHKIEWPVAQLLHGQRQQTEQAEINSTGMKLIFKMNAILELPPAPPPSPCAFLIRSSEHVVVLWNKYRSQCHRNNEHTVPLL